MAKYTRLPPPIDAFQFGHEVPSEWFDAMVDADEIFAWEGGGTCKKSVAAKPGCRDFSPGDWLVLIDGKVEIWTDDGFRSRHIPAD